MSEAATTTAPAQPTATAIDAIASAAPKGGGETAQATQAPAEGGQAHNAVPPAPKAPAPAPAQDEYFDVPIDGKKVRMTKAELLQSASLGKQAYKKFEEAASMRKQAEGLLTRLKDPRQAIKLLQDPSLGLDEGQVREAFEEWYADRFIAREQMTEEQRELADAKERLRHYEETEKQAKEREEREAQSKQDADYLKHVQQEIIKTVEESKLPKTKFMVSRIAYWTKINESKGLNAPRELIVQQVRKEMRDVMRSLVDASDGDTLLDVLGEDTVKKVRSHDLARIRARRNAPPAPQTQAPKSSDPSERLTEHEVKMRARKLWT